MSGNLFQDVPRALPDEQFRDLLRLQGLKIERIVSTGHTTPLGEWYDQDQHEWVLLLRGSAELIFADAPDEPVPLHPGDYLHIPPHRRHRVSQTSADEPTVWLAVHYEPDWRDASSAT